MTREAKADGLIHGLGLGKQEHVAVVGGGGKTSLCLALAGEMVSRARKTVVTTTTRMAREESLRFSCRILEASPSRLLERVTAALETQLLVFVARMVLDTAKVKGLLPETADALFRCGGMDGLIVEADGADRKPLKAPAAHEPVIPATATTAIVILGLEVLGSPLQEDRVFRAELFSRISGMSPGQRMTPEGVAQAFQTKDGLFKGIPASARRIVFLNKLDLLMDPAPARDLARRLLAMQEGRVDRVVMGSLKKNLFYILQAEESGSKCIYP